MLLCEELRALWLRGEVLPLVDIEVEFPGLSDLLLLLLLLRSEWLLLDARHLIDEVLLSEHRHLAADEGLVAQALEQ